METKLFYSVQNGGDGSAYPIWFESMKLAELDQEYMDEGWGEPCDGYITVESETPITIKETVQTAQMVIDDIVEELGYGQSDYYEENLNKHLAAVRKLSGIYFGDYAI